MTLLGLTVSIVPLRGEGVVNGVGGRLATVLHLLVGCALVPFLLLVGLGGAVLAVVEIPIGLSERPAAGLHPLTFSHDNLAILLIYTLGYHVDRR